MGMYTEIYINVDLKKETPKEIIDTLKAMCAHEPLSIEFPERWSRLFSNGSHYVPLTCCANLTFNTITKQWSLLGKGDIKNYENEIEEFFTWIMPWIDGSIGDFIGYTRYEEDQIPLLRFLTSI